MDIHEYQAKEILASYGVKIAEGGLAYSPEDAVQRTREIGGNRYICTCFYIKTRAHLTGRACLMGDHTLTQHSIGGSFNLFMRKANFNTAGFTTRTAQGKGAAALDGRLIDAASEKMANNVVNTATAIAAKA
jgi:hypothetical protein